MSDGAEKEREGERERKREREKGESETDRVRHARSHKVGEMRRGLREM